MNSEQIEALIVYIGTLIDLKTPEYLIYPACDLWIFRAKGNITEQDDQVVMDILAWYEELIINESKRSKQNFKG